MEYGYTRISRANEILVVQRNRYVGRGHGAADVHIADAAGAQRQLFADLAGLFDQLPHVFNVNLRHKNLPFC